MLTEERWLTHALMGDSHRVANAAFIANGSDVEAADAAVEVVGGRVVDSYPIFLDGDSLIDGSVEALCEGCKLQWRLYKFSW